MTNYIAITTPNRRRGKKGVTRARIEVREEEEEENIEVMEKENENIEVMGEEKENNFWTMALSQYKLHIRA